MAPSTHDLRDLADRIAQALAVENDVRAVCLVGSVARGDQRSDSDLDLVVIATTRLRGSELMARLPEDLHDGRVSVLPFSVERWLEEAADGSLFVHHVRLEGAVLLDRDGVLRRGFDLVAARRPNVQHELRRQISRLRLYRDPERLNGQHLFALAHLYAIGKSVAIARCAELGEMTFVKQDAFRCLAERRPGLADEVDAVARLRPFYDLTHERAPESLPFPHQGADQEIFEATRSIERLARA
jgi:predicted nucleotidyltransferase